MTELQSHLNALEGYLQEEIGARKRTLELLRTQEHAILANDPDKLESATDELARAVAAAEARAERRTRLLERLGAHFGIAAEALTLASTAERIGEGAERLLAQRAELRDLTREVLETNRRLAALFRLHRQVLRDVVQAVLASSAAAEDDPWRGSGALLNAEA